MNVIFAISPNHLEALYEESKNFDFVLQGYGNIKDSYKGLQGVNIKNILGFVYLGDILPDVKQLNQFLQICNLIAANKPRPFVLALASGVSISASVNTKKYKNLRFYTLPPIEILTNLVIRADIFGPILLENFKPYQFDDEVDDTQISSLNTIEYRPIISKIFYGVLSPVRCQESIQECVEMDKIYNNFLTSNKLLASCRLVVVKCAFYDKRGFITSELKQDLDTSIQKINVAVESITDVKIYCCMMVISGKLQKMVDSLKVI